MENSCRSVCTPHQKPDHTESQTSPNHSANPSEPHTSTNDPETSAYTTPRAPKRKGIRSPQKLPSSTMKSKNVCFAPPTHPSRFVPGATSTPVRLQFRDPARDQAVQKALTSSQYYTAYRNIFNRSEASRRAFNRLVKNTVAEEVKRYSKQKMEDLIYPQLNGMEDVKAFSWDDLNEDVKCKMPTFFSSLDGALNCKLRRRKKPLSEEQAAKHRYPIQFIIPLLFSS